MQSRPVSLNLTIIKMLYRNTLNVYRNFIKNKLSSFINIFGFMIGVAAFILIVSAIKYEKGYDSFYSNAHHIYRVGIRFFNNGNLVNSSMVQYPVGMALQNDYGQDVERYARVWLNYNITVSYKEKSFYEKNIYNVDPVFPLMFCQMVTGDKATCLQEHNSVIISEEVARKYFEQENPIGKIMLVSRYGPHKVTGVFKDITHQSHFNFEVLVPLHHLEKEFTNNWDSHNFYTYIQLKENVNREAFERKLESFVHRYRNKYFQTTSLKEAYFLQPVRDIRLYSDLLLDFKQNGHGQVIPLYILSAVVIILFAVFNYFNFAISNTLAKAKEIGIRQVLGATKKEIVLLVMTESFLYNLTGTVLGGLIAIIAFPAFADYFGIQTDVALASNAWFWQYTLLVLVINTLISGWYPIILSFSFKLSEIIRGKKVLKHRGINVRKVLTVTQYTISCLLLIFALVSYRQINFMREHNLGFNKDNMLVVRAPVILKTGVAPTQTYQLIRGVVNEAPAIHDVCFSDYVPGGGYEQMDRINVAGHQDTYDTYANAVSHNFIDVYKIRLLAGKNFSPEQKSDAAKSVIINQTLARKLGLKPEKAINTEVEYKGRKRIIGVIADFHQESLKKQTAPLVLMQTEWPDYFTFALTGNNAETALGAIKARWNLVFPGDRFDYFYIDQYIDQNYRKDQVAWQILRVYAFLAIFISFLGLLGIVIDQVKQMTKEIAIRKVLCATQWEILWGFQKKIFKLILIAFLIGLPLQVFLLNKWLQNFPYRIELSAWYFLFPIALLVSVAWIIISIRVIKVTSSNLLYALKAE